MRYLILLLALLIGCSSPTSQSNLPDDVLLVYAKHAHIDFGKQELYLTHIVYHEAPENYNKNKNELKVYFNSDEAFKVAKTLIGDYSMIYLNNKNDSLFYKKPD